MPFPWEQHEHLALLDVLGSSTFAYEPAAAAGYVKQLIFIQYAAFLCVEQITGRMQLRRIWFILSYQLLTDRIYGESP
jgi:hypothetical protein